MISDLELISPFQECVELEAAGTPIKENPERKEEIELSLDRCKRAKTRPNHLEGYDPSTKNSSQTQHCRSNTRRKESKKMQQNFAQPKFRTQKVCVVSVFFIMLFLPSIFLESESGFLNLPFILFSAVIVSDI